MNFLILIKDAIVYLNCDAPTSTDIRSYIHRSNVPDEHSTPATDSTNHVPTTSHSFDLTENCHEESSIDLEEGWTLCDIEP